MRAGQSAGASIPNVFEIRFSVGTTCPLSIFMRVTRARLVGSILFTFHGTGVEPGSKAHHKCSNNT